MTTTMLITTMTTKMMLPTTPCITLPPMTSKCSPQVQPLPYPSLTYLHDPTLSTTPTTIHSTWNNCPIMAQMITNKMLDFAALWMPDTLLWLHTLSQHTQLPCIPHNPFDHATGILPVLQYRDLIPATSQALSHHCLASAPPYHCNATHKCPFLYPTCVCMVKDCMALAYNLWPP